jgi:hypothetical protein
MSVVQVLPITLLVLSTLSVGAPGEEPDAARPEPGRRS